MVLMVADKIDISTDHGDCQLELCVGDITHLKDPVDVLVVSAFSGDYTPTATSVIGALQRELNFSVQKVSRNKEEDLRKHFSCWWSKELPKKFCFRRILCFEGGFKVNSLPPLTISEVFRCLVSLCKEEDITVAMPLLASGNQGYSASRMMKLIVNAAIHWMQIGLPLKVLKLVVYARNALKPDKMTVKLCETFAELKKEWERKLDVVLAENTEKREFDYDVYLSYSQRDEPLAKDVLQMLKMLKKSIKVYSVKQELDKEKAWQDGIYEVMVRCARVMTLLSPHFMEDSSCVEQYNMALCCSRNMKRDYLAPLYVADITQMPTYMGLVQYVDCRPVDRIKIQCACETVSVYITDTSMCTHNVPRVTLGFHYDLFVSYAHKDTHVQRRVVEKIKELQPDWKIFVDQSELSAGTTWQTKLYTSIENSSYFLALLSSDYLQSKVCQEEYNLAQALHDDPAYSTRLFRFCVSEITDWPTWCWESYFVPFNNSEAFDKRVVRIVDRMLHEAEDVMSRCFMYPIQEITSLWRKEMRLLNYPVLPGVELCESLTGIFENEFRDDKFHVFLSYHERDSVYANILVEALAKHLPSLRVSLPSSHHHARLHVIDNDVVVVPLLSSRYLKSPDLMAEYNIALCRHRFSKDLVVCPIVVEELPHSPVYPLIAFHMFSVVDSSWASHNSPVSTCLEMAAVVIANIVVYKPRAPGSFKTLLSIRELNEWKNCHARGEEAKFNPLLFNVQSCEVQSTKIPVVNDESKKPVESEDASFICLNGDNTCCVINDRNDDAFSISQSIPRDEILPIQESQDIKGNELNGCPNKFQSNTNAASNNEKEAASDPHEVNDNDNTPSVTKETERSVTRSVRHSVMCSIS